MGGRVSLWTQKERCFLVRTIPHNPIDYSLLVVIEVRKHILGHDIYIYIMVRRIDPKDDSWHHVKMQGSGNRFKIA